MGISLPFEGHPGCALDPVFAAIRLQSRRPIFVQIDTSNIEAEAAFDLLVHIPSDIGNLVISPCTNGSDLSHVVLRGESVRRLNLASTA